MQRLGEREELERGEGEEKETRSAAAVGVWSRGIGKVRGRVQLGGAE